MDSDQASSSNKMDTDPTPSSQNPDPVCVIILGMAGSGKSALTTKLVSKLFAKRLPPYVINCDPACLQTEYLCNIDIRDSIQYKKVMEKYKLGPNGAIITSLNLFVTNFDQVLTLIDKRRETHRYALLDTPGQVEVFTWSASGTIITEALASKFPTVILFVVDTVRSNNPTTFMSNMLYACSIVYKYKLPLVIVFNKCDCIDPTFAFDWMANSELFEAEINHDDSYMACLNQSLTTALDIFYQDLPRVAVSCKTGEGFDGLLDAINKAAKEYETTYKPAMEKKAEEARLARLEKDVEGMNIAENYPQKDECLANTSLSAPAMPSEDLMIFGPKTTNQFE